MKTLKRTWADISLDNLEHNINAIRTSVPTNTKLLCLLKADAYGHGAVPLAHAMPEMGVDYLAVSNLDEAVQLRRDDIHTPILILGYTPATFAEMMVFMDIRQEVHSYEYAAELDAQLYGGNYTLNVHLKLDTGMTRLGFLTDHLDQTVRELEKIVKLPHLHVEGVFTHFSASDSLHAEDIAYTKQQFSRFQAALEVLSSLGIHPELRHCSNSGAAILYPEYSLDMIRPGIAVYGIHPSPETRGKIDLRPVMSLRTIIGQLRDVPAGSEVGYGRSYVTARPSRLAVLPVGYADGLERRLSNCGEVLLHGKLVPIVGRICMDMCVVDVTNVNDAAVGDVVTIFGESEGVNLPCERITNLLDTIPYELLSTISKRIPRICIKNGKPSEILQYIV